MTTPENASGTDLVHALVSQREQLRAWIARLDEVQTGTPSRVAERVRADYEDRLRRVTEDLSAHGEEIQRNLQALQDELAAAEQRRAHAADALEETRLRHVIGELDEPAWDQARAPLEQDVAAADQAVAQTRGEVEHLSSLSAEIVGRGQAEEAAGEDDPEQGGGDGEDEDAGDELVFYTPDEDEPQASAAPAGEPAAWDAPSAAAPATADAEEIGDEGVPGDGPLSGEELAAWISEVEAETSGEEPEARDEAPEPAAASPVADTTPASPAPAESADADGWDPFANEFGGSPAAPTTQPGDAAQDLPWLDSLQGGAAGKWAAPPAGEGDELAFLENLETPAPAASTPPAAADLAADDLAFLEELDRAISGGQQRAPQTPAPAAEPAQGGLGSGFEGGSGDGFITAEPGEVTREAPRKRGEALLCKECGAINEPQAWYCEICGSEL